MRRGTLSVSRAALRPLPFRYDYTGSKSVRSYPEVTLEIDIAEWCSYLTYNNAIIGQSIQGRLVMAVVYGFVLIMYQSIPLST